MGGQFATAQYLRRYVLEGQEGRRDELATAEVLAPEGGELRDGQR